MIKIYTRPLLVYEEKEYLILVYPTKEVKIPITLKESVLAELDAADMVTEK